MCEGIGEDFGFNPVFLRVPLAAIVLWNPVIAIGAYFALGAVVLASRLLFPKAKAHRSRRVGSRAPAVGQRADRIRRKRPSRASEFSAGFGARFEQVEQRAVLQQQLLAAEGECASACRSLGARSTIATTEVSSGSDGAGASVPARAAARSSKRRIGHQSPTSAVAAPSAQPLRSDIASVSSAWRAATRLDSVSAAPGVLGSGPTAEVSRTR